MIEHPTDLLTAYIDDELNESQFSKLRAHLTLCTSCQNELEQHLALRDLLQTASVVPTRVTATEFWQKLAPLLPPSSPPVSKPASLGIGWAWAGAMVLFAALSQAIVFTLVVANLVTSAGFPITRWLPLDAIIRLDSGTSWVAIWAMVEHSLLGLLLSTPIAPLLPAFFLLLLTTGLALGFLGWGLAKLHQPQSTV